MGRETRGGGQGQANGRWPRKVFAAGEEPDYRFSFANERTFLAWIRTAVALVAAGIALHAIDLSMSDVFQRVVSSILVALGTICAGVSWFRWAAAELAMRKKDPLPTSRMLLILPMAVVALSVVIAVSL